MFFLPFFHIRCQIGCMLDFYQIQMTNVALKVKIAKIERMSLLLKINPIFMTKNAINQFFLLYNYFAISMQLHQLHNGIRDVWSKFRGVSIAGLVMALIGSFFSILVVSIHFPIQLKFGSARQNCTYMYNFRHTGYAIRVFLVKTILNLYCDWKVKFFYLYMHI